MMMRNLTVTLSVFFLLSSFGCDKSAPSDEPSGESVEEAESPQAEAPPQEGAPEAESDTPDKPEASPAVDKSLLWKVNGPNGPVYLFGTVHGGIEGGWDEFPADVRTALKESEVVVLEADVANAESAALQARDKMIYPPEESLSDKLGRDAFATLVEQLGTPGNVLEQLRPWAAYAELTRKWLPAGTAVDEMVHKRGNKLNKDFEYFETIAQQIDILADSITVEVLRDTLERAEEMRAEQSQLIAAYKAGDAEKLEEVAFDEKEMERFPALYEALFDERNEAWMSDLEQYLKRGNVFVAVGVGHLVGEGGLVSRLEKKGFEVERTAAE